MEGVEPFGTDLNQLRVFYELGVRAIGLTHARTNAAGHWRNFCGERFAARRFDSRLVAMWCANAKPSG